MYNKICCVDFIAASLPAATMPAQLTREGMTIAYPTMVGPGGLTFVTAAQASAILLVSNLNEEVMCPITIFLFPSIC